MEDKVVEIARFRQFSEAEMLANLIKSEGIECYVRDGISSPVLGYIDIGGAKVELLKKDARKALEIMKDHYYELPDDAEYLLEEEYPDGYTVEKKFEDGYVEYENTDMESEYAKSKAKLSKTMTIIITLMAILLCILIFLNKYYNG